MNTYIFLTHSDRAKEKKFNFKSKRMKSGSCIFLLIALFSCAPRSIEKITPASEKANLNRNHYKVIPDELYEKTQLKELHLYENELDSLSYKIAQLENLEELYIGKNKLKKLPDEICRLKKLRILSIQYNELEELPDSIGQLDNLEQLILNQNRLTTLPKSIGQLKKLQILQVNWNFLTELPVELYSAQNLRYIDLGRNRLTVIPEQLSQLQKLNYLKLKDAGILLQLPESICELRRLETLEIDMNTVLPVCLRTQKTTRLQIILD